MIADNKEHEIKTIDI